MTGLASTLPTASEQFGAVLGAPIPFALALLGVGVVIWRAMEWAYRQRIDLWQTMHAQVAVDNQIIKDRVTRLEANDLSQRKEIAELRERAKDNPALQPAILRLSQSTDEAKTLLVQLGQANSAISEALSRAGTPVVLRVTPGRYTGGELTQPVYVPEDEKNES
jgi:hypothetical protein